MIVLASTSLIRRKLLETAGVVHKTARPPVEETPIKDKLRAAGNDVQQVAEALAEAKATSVGAVVPGAFVIGADQMLDCQGEWLDKPVDRRAAKWQLKLLRGKTHRLISAVTVCAAGSVLWKHVEVAELTMRDFSDSFLDSYLDQAGDQIASSVGGYQLEGHGIQLFEKIVGDYFAILGLPLLPLLAALRNVGALPE